MFVSLLDAISGLTPAGWTVSLPFLISHHASSASADGMFGEHDNIGMHRRGARERAAPADVSYQRKEITEWPSSLGSFPPGGAARSTGDDCAAARREVGCQHRYPIALRPASSFRDSGCRLNKSALSAPWVSNPTLMGEAVERQFRAMGGAFLRSTPAITNMPEDGCMPCPVPRGRRRSSAR
jgi:hypothetical protein